MINKKNESVNAFYNTVLIKKEFYLPIIFFSILSYGYSLFSRTVSADDLARSYYIEGNKMIASFRWGHSLSSYLFSSPSYPYQNLELTIAVFMLVFTSIVISYIFFYITNDCNKTHYAIICSFFITYPLLNEIIGAAGLSVLFSFDLLLIVLGLLIIINNDSDKSIKKLIIAGIIISPAMAGYESVIFVYVTLVFIILYLKEINGKQYQKGWFFDGLSYVLPLVVALLLRYIVGFSLIKLYGLEYQNVGSASIDWFTNSFKESILQILYNGWYYVIRGFSYFPIGEFVISMIIFLVITIKERINGKKNILPIAFFLIMSLFFLSFLQAKFIRYLHNQTIQVFVPFVAYLLLTEISDKKIFNINIKAVITVLLFYVSFRQSVYLHQLLALNNQRSDNEMAVFREIGYKIYSEFDKDKTVIFCGEYQLGDYIEDQITVKEGSIAEKVEDWFREITGKEEGRLYQEFVSTNVNSYYNTQKDAFSGQVMIKYYMSYLGYDINVVDNLTDEEEEYLKHGYEEIAKKENMKPYEIKDMGDYLLVYLGPTIDGEAE